MYYICKKKEQSLGTLYGIMDTDDGVVEYYSPRDIIDIIKVHGLHIEGVSLNTDTNKWSFKVLKPTAFVEAETSSYSASPKVTNSTNSSSEITSKMLKDGIEIDYPANWGSFDSLSDEKVYNILEVLKNYLDFVVIQLGISQPRHLDFIDGCDCVGYDNLCIPNTPYCISIFANPDYATAYSSNLKDGKVVIGGIGVDVSGIEGKSMDECHFDLRICDCDTFTDKLKTWLNNLIK